MPDAEKDALTMEQIEAMVEEVIQANTVWPDPLPSQVSAVMDTVREAMAQAWDEGSQANYLFERGEVYPEPSNPYCAARVLPPASDRGASDV